MDLCFKTQNEAHRAAAAGFDFQNVHFELKSLAPNLNFVSVFLPIEFSDNELKDLLCFYGEVVKSVRRLFHKEDGLENLENGCRVVAFSKLAKPLPVPLPYKGISIGFNYTGQPKSYLRCSSFDHLVAKYLLKRARSAATINQQATTPAPRQAKHLWKLQRVLKAHHQVNLRRPSAKLNAKLLNLIKDPLTLLPKDKEKSLP